MLLAARDELTGAAMTDQQVRDEVLTILIAGHETVASALTWSWYLLALHPEITRRAWQRKRNCLPDASTAGCKTGRCPSCPSPSRSSKRRCASTRLPG
jgi:cytochrome P450